MDDVCHDLPWFLSLMTVTSADGQSDCAILNRLQSYLLKMEDKLDLFRFGIFHLNVL